MDSVASAEKAGADVEKFVQRTTVFHAVMKIYKEEGVAALYDGVWGEIFKGFLSHGMTMIIKEEIHKLIIRMYFWVLRKLDRFPSAEELKAQAGDKFNGMVEGAREGLGNVTSAGKQGVEGAVEKVKAGVEVAGERLNGVTGNVRGGAEGVLVKGKDGTEAAGKRLGVVGNNTIEVAKNAEDFMSKEAGHLLGNAHEQLGGKIEELGKGIKKD